MNSNDKKEALKILSSLDILSGSIIFNDGDVLDVQWDHLDNLNKLKQGESACSCGDSLHTREDPNECDCDGPDEIVVGPDENPSGLPPARYFIQASGQGYWCSNVKMNPVMGVDVIWTQKINGKDVTVTGTLYETNLAIFDYETPTTLEAFENAKKATFDYMAQKIHNVKEAEEKAKEELNNDSRISSKKPTESASTEAVMKSYG